MANLTFYFNEQEHSYYDSAGNTYISVTTLLKQYEKPFNEEYWAVFTWLRDNGYKVKKATTENFIYVNGVHYSIEKAKRLVGATNLKKILKKWNDVRVDAGEFGTSIHNAIEESIDNAMTPVEGKDDVAPFLGMDSVNTTNADAVFSVTESIQRNHISNYNEHLKEYMVVKTIGAVTITAGKVSTDKDMLRNSFVGTNDVILNKLIELVQDGYTIYSEIRLYDSKRLISGTTDVIAIKGNCFLIIDWKTNKYHITFKSGYWKKVKDDKGNTIITDEFVENNETFISPISKLPLSLGNKQALQLSMYARMIEELSDMLCMGLMVFHMKKSQFENVIEYTKEVSMPYLVQEVVDIFDDYTSKNLIDKYHKPTTISKYQFAFKIKK